MGKGGMKILYLYHKGQNGYYLENVVRYMNEVLRVYVHFDRLAYFKDDTLKEDFDVFIYQTFPDEFSNKFNFKKTIKRFDNIFLKFKGVKILYDTHDDGNKDAYTRFNNLDPHPSVIKSSVGKYYPKLNHVILNTGLSLSTTEYHVYKDEFTRDIQISFKHGQIGNDYYPHYVRESADKMLKENFDLSDVSYERTTSEDLKQARKDYVQELRRTLISVGCCGFGQSSGSYADCLRAGALLYAHCSLKDIQFLPNEDLIDGVDYISWNSHNFCTKLKWLLDKPSLIEKVRKNGRRKFAGSYNFGSSASKLMNFLEKEVVQ